MAPTTPDGGPSGTSPAIIRPGQAADVRVGLGMACNGGVGARTLTDFVLVGAGYTVAVPGLRLSGTCSDIYVSNWFTK